MEVTKPWQRITRFAQTSRKTYLMKKLIAVRPPAGAGASKRIIELGKIVYSRSKH